MVGKNPEAIIDGLQTTLDNLHAYAETWGLAFQPEKCKFMVITRRRDFPGFPNFRLGAHVLEEVDTYKYLGVTIDRHLTWRAHIDYLCDTSQKRINLLRAVSSTRWGASRRVLTTLYTHLVRSRLDYSCALYGSAAPTQLERLAKLQHKALRAILGVPKTIPIALMEAEAAIPPLDLRRESLELAWFALAASAEQPSWYRDFLIGALDRSRPLDHRWRTSGAPAPLRAAKAAGYYNLEWMLSRHFDQDRPPAYPAWESPPLAIVADWLKVSKKELPAEALQQEFLLELARHTASGARPVYTDGSLVQDFGAGGAAFFAPDSDSTGVLTVDPGHSICRVELQAIQMALIHIRDNLRSAAVVCSDSKAALTVLRNNREDLFSRQIFAICEELPFAVTLLWCPAHIGLVGNERADRLARSAISCCPPHVEKFVPHTTLELKAACNRAVSSRWVARWTILGAGKPLLRSKPIPSSTFLGSLRLPRLQDSLLARLNCGRLPTRSTLHRFRVVPSPLCAVCAVAESDEHVIFVCPARGVLRRPFLEELRRLRLPATLADLLPAVNGGNELVARALAAFLAKLKWF